MAALYLLSKLSFFGRLDALLPLFSIFLFFIDHADGIIFKLELISDSLTNWNEFRIVFQISFCIHFNMEEDWDIEKYHNYFEPEEQWEMKKKFMEENKSMFTEERVVCLAQVLVNVEFLGTR